MKRLFALLCLAVLVCGCAEKPDPKPEPEPDPVDWKTTYNGQLVLALADAYATWEADNKLPSVIKWEGVNIFTREYVRAGLALAVKILDNPDKWMEEDVVYPSATFSLTTDVPFVPVEVPFSAFKQLLREQYRNMTELKEIKLNMKIPGYEPNLSSTGLLVMMCRAFAYYAENGKFPEKINTWESSYTHSTANCDINAPEVKATRDAAWAKAGVTENSTVREKADAIFCYARDEWERLDYNNTRRGAVGTIRDKGGNCCDLSHAVLAMARLSGIPGRYFHAQCYYSSGIIGHVISQLFIDGEWVMADASNNGNKLGTVAFKGYENMHLYEELDF